MVSGGKGQSSRSIIPRDLNKDRIHFVFGTWPYPDCANVQLILTRVDFVDL